MHSCVCIGFVCCCVVFFLKMQRFKVQVPKPPQTLSLSFPPLISAEPASFIFQNGPFSFFSPTAPSVPHAAQPSPPTRLILWPISLLPPLSHQHPRPTRQGRHLPHDVYNLRRSPASPWLLPHPGALPSPTPLPFPPPSAFNALTPPPRPSSHATTAPPALPNLNGRTAWSSPRHLSRAPFSSLSAL